MKNLVKDMTKKEYEVLHLCYLYTVVKYHWFLRTGGWNCNTIILGSVYEGEGRDELAYPVG